jgi:tRNA threonylcarbamoyladenosine biosynthesis protein TsaB
MSATLAIETAFPDIDVALELDGEVRRAGVDLSARRASALHQAVAELIEGVELSEIRADIGPGSYTGLRVGLAFVRTWRILHPVPIRVCYSTDLLALAATEHVATGEDYVITMDARRGQWFGARYRREESGPTRLCDPTCLPPEELATWAEGAAHAFSTHDEVPLELPHQKLATPNAEQLLRGEQLLFDKTDPMPVYLMPPI